ncbi:hypothetical protein C0R09_18515 [Brevibacillus laterosporus]|uniref:hypothetical protein n=1 Tax=Brevibacillus laterosporus TaxID=1465 RepID=UPI000C75B935|nr:hypothetical protein [Brevibacillus laterosporus]AUM66352.1 hypothetical protein C0R09_18515 [Brevibacillus laterosporus]
MITYAEVKCYNCENKFPVYWHDWEKNLPIKCPFCVTQFTDRQTEHLKLALGTASELNGKLRSEAMDGGDLFQVDFKHVFVPVEKYRLDD